MPTNTQPLPPLPDPSVAIVDPATGKVTKPWFLYLTALDRIVRALRLEIP